MIVTGSVTVMPKIRTSASQVIPTPIGTSLGIRMSFISVIQTGWLAMSLRTSHVCSIPASTTTIEWIGSGSPSLAWSPRTRSRA